MACPGASDESQDVVQSKFKISLGYPGPETRELIPGNVASTHGGSEASNRCVVTEHLPKAPGVESCGPPGAELEQGAG